MKLRGLVVNKFANSKQNDCTVRALATVTGLDYWIVFEALKLEGRRDNSGWDIDAWLKRNQFVAFGFRFHRTSPDGEGKYLLYNNGHCWAIVDGKLYDYANSRASRYTDCYLVFPSNGRFPDKTEGLLAQAKRIAEVKYFQD